MSYSAIVSKLEIPNSTVGHIVKKWKDGKRVRDVPTLGAPRKATHRQDALIRRKSVADPNNTADEICKEVTIEHRHTVSTHQTSSGCRWIECTGSCKENPLIRTDKKENLIEIH